MQRRSWHKGAIFSIWGLLALGMLAGSALAQGGSVAPSSWFVDMKRYGAAAHASLACAKCHPAEDLAANPQSVQKGMVRPHPDTQSADYLKSPARRRYDYGRCADCHRLAYARFQKGAHAKALRDKLVKTTPYGRIEAPVCGDCHDAHYEPAHLGRVDEGRRQVPVCGACHPIQQATYLQDYHGKAAVNLGYEKSAFCSDCHGAHECLSLKDSRAAWQACRRCHPQAEPRFAQYVVHPATADLGESAADKAKKDRVRLIGVLTVLMAVVALLVVGFFYGHNFIWLLRDLHHKIRKR
jgi:hypothetical protein